MSQEPSRRRHPDFEVICAPASHDMPSIGGSESRKRRRLSRPEPSSTSQIEDTNPPIEEIDLTEVEGRSSLSKVLAKQREDAVAAQKSPGDEKGRSILTSHKCPICMDTPVDATSTVCGHLFCHKCIIDSLKFSEDQRADASGKTPRGTCPVCRKTLLRIDSPGPKRNLVPLQIKLYTRKKVADTRNEP